MTIASFLASGVRIELQVTFAKEPYKRDDMTIASFLASGVRKDTWSEERHFNKSFECLSSLQLQQVFPFLTPTSTSLSSSTLKRLVEVGVRKA